MMGQLYGIDFQREHLSGHIYFWSFSAISYNLFSFEKEEDIIKETLITELPEDTQFESMLNAFVNEVEEISVSP